MWGDRIIGTIFIDETLNAERYLSMLQEEILPSLLNEEGVYPVYFQQDGAPPHYGPEVRRYLDHQFPKAWIGRRGPVEWPPRSLTPRFLSLGALEGQGVPGKDTGHKSSQGSYHHRHHRHNFICANACSSKVENTYQYVYSKQW